MSKEKPDRNKKSRRQRRAITNEQIVAILELLGVPWGGENHWTGKMGDQGTTAYLGEKIRAILTGRDDDET